MKLFEPIKIGTMQLKNRVFMCPMGTLPAEDYSYSDRNIRYLADRAKGGIGLIIPGGAHFNSEFEGFLSYTFFTPNFAKQLNLLARQIHQYGSKLCVQIVPGAGRCHPGWGAGVEYVYSSSETPTFWNPNRMCKPYTTEQVKGIVKKFGEAAAIAKHCGADCIEVHAYGGYLTDNFLSSLWNHRTDEYGGSLENRMRFPVELIQEAKKTCGSDFPVLIKFTPFHDIEGGRELDEGIEIAKGFEAAGADALHIDVGCYENWNRAVSTVYDKTPSQIDIAAEVKKHVSIPVFAQGKLSDPEMAEAALQKGQADVIGLGHQTIADPEWVNKVRKNEPYDIVPCIYCNECTNAEFSEQHLHCAVNPVANQEEYFDHELKKTENKLRVLVVGGGPGGMEAAITAAERGHEVELWEKSNKLGGQLIPAGTPQFKKDVSNYREFLIGKIFRMPIRLKMLKEATAESILAGNFDKVILATGASPVLPPIEGAIGNAKVVLAKEVLEGHKEFGKNVVVIGGGLVGCETAVHCAYTADSVTVIEILDDILLTAGHCKNMDLGLRSLLKKYSVKTVCGAKVSRITDGKIEYEHAGSTEKLEADTIIIAAGVRSNNSLFEKIAEQVDTDIIGDASAPGKIINAVHQGFFVANKL